MLVILNPKESFRSIVGLNIVHLVRREEFFVLFPVRFKIHSSMGKYFHVRPNFHNIRFARFLKYLFAKTPIHGGTTCKRSNILVEGGLYNFLNFLFKFLN